MYRLSKLGAQALEQETRRLRTVVQLAQGRLGF
jgi:hypothetical protein